MIRLRLLRPWRPPRAPARPAPYEVPGSGVTDLAAFIYAQHAAVHPALRQRAVWVMNQHWWGHCRAAAGPVVTMEWPHPTGMPAGRMLLGLPVRLDPLGGWPHLRDAEPQRWLAGVRAGGRFYPPHDVDLIWKQVP